MKKIGYFFLTGLFYFLSILPFWLLYLLSDGIFFLMYYIVRYRRKVVVTNLHNSFPEKSEVEIHKISKEFYKYLCDQILETFKTLTISKSEMLKRCSFTEESKVVFNALAEQHKSAMIVMGHYGNWEWAGNSFTLMFKHKLYVLFHPITNKYFNSFFYNMRSRFGTGLIAMQDTIRDMIKIKDELHMTAFIADQTPLPQNAYWTTFLNQETAVFKGYEKIAQKFNYPIVYIVVQRPKRGYYTIHAEILIAESNKQKEGDIIHAFTKRLEQDIIQQPAIWLWSHKRWKHKRKLQD